MKFISTAKIPWLFSSKQNKKREKISFYDISLNTLQGVPIDLAQYKGKKILIVNVASKCGFTKQYKDLQKLQDLYKNDLNIIGVPCNQFGNQEPGNAEDIENFCSVNYGVTFLITEKIKVKGSDQHPLYMWLTNKKHNDTKSSTVKWNFQKFLIDEKGTLIDYYLSTTNPISSKITKHLK
ncbi:glutathione peroxidase [Aquimarina sp. W85]|uniref:glutathione peroxidase n=1 Tax=Aquimarina rhodophyticola TaxID=3342246 RepID=UPI00366E8233